MVRVVRHVRYDLTQPSARTGASGAACLVQRVTAHLSSLHPQPPIALYDEALPRRTAFERDQWLLQLLLTNAIVQPLIETVVSVASAFSLALSPSRFDVSCVATQVRSRCCLCTLRCVLSSPMSSETGMVKLPPHALHNLLTCPPPSG